MASADILADAVASARFRVIERVLLLLVEGEGFRFLSQQFLLLPTFPVLEFGLIDLAPLPLLIITCVCDLVWRE